MSSRQKISLSDIELPQSFETEQNYLRILVNDTSKIKPGDENLMYSPEHKNIFLQIIKQRDNGLAKSDYADLLRLLDGKSIDHAQQIFAYKVEERLCDYYRNVLSDLSERRQVVAKAINIIELAQDQNQHIDRIAIECDKLRIERSGGEATTSKDLVAEFDQWFSDLQDGKLDNEGISWGFGIDEIIDKLRPSELCLIGGRPSAGKSSIANSVVALSCVPHKRPVLIFSLEQSRRKAIQRLVSIAGRIPFASMNERNRLNSEEYKSMADAMTAIHASNIGISDNTYSLWEISNTAREFHRIHGLDLIIIDYAQLVRVNGLEPKDALDEVGINAKILAKDLNTCVILITSINWEHEAPFNCSALEYHCDQYIIVHKDVRIENGQTEKKITIRKQRDGPVGDIWIPWYGPCMAFY